MTKGEVVRYGIAFALRRSRKIILGLKEGLTQLDLHHVGRTSTADAVGLAARHPHARARSRRARPRAAGQRAVSPQPGHAGRGSRRHRRAGLPRGGELDLRLRAHRGAAAQAGERGRSPAVAGRSPSGGSDPPARPGEHGRERQARGIASRDQGPRGHHQGRGRDSPKEPRRSARRAAWSASSAWCRAARRRTSATTRSGSG